jgi:hydrophobe/amphiphile efflux-3 (HAE3) family protein
MSNPFGRLAAWAVGHARLVVSGAVLLTLLGTIGALRLESDAATDTLVDRGSETFHTTERFKEQFGDDPVVILVRGQLEQLLLTRNIESLLRLEGCLSGRVPEGQEPATETCGEIADLNPSQVVFGPATFLNQAAIRAQELLTGQSQAAVAQAREAAAQAAQQARRQGLSTAEQEAAARAAGEQVLGEFQRQLLNLAVRYGQTSLPSLDDPRYVSSVVFDTRFAGGVPKERFAYLFPSPEAALISVRLRPDLTEAERDRAIELFRQAVGEEDFRLDGGSYVISGIPVVVEGLSAELEGEIFILLAVALALMALTLTAIFGPPLRLLPLAVALSATALAFGGLALFGGSLTMASLAVLPVLIGLAVDYAIQFQARFREALAAGAEPAAAARGAAQRGGPVIATAGLATMAGFVVLLLSPIPLVRTFGLLLVLGIAIAFAIASTAGFAVLALAGSGTGRGRRRGSRARARPRRATRRAGRIRVGAMRLGAFGHRIGNRIEAARAAAGKRLRGVAKAAVATSITAPGRVLAVAVVLAVAGWAAGTRTEVVSDIRELVPGDLPALEDVDVLQDATGVSGELNVVVDAPDLTDPELVAWMSEFKQRVLARHGFEGEFPSCEEAELCPAVALPDLFGTERDLTRGRIRSVLAAIPPYFSQAVIAPDEAAAEGEGRGGTANLAFGIPVMPLSDQKALIDDIRSQIDPPGSENDPPEGVEASVAGLPVLAADANSQLSGSRYWLTLAGLAAVALVLLAVYRSPGRALVPLIPIVLATGWSAMVLAAMEIPLNPMSATLGALVIAIATEFSVILTARYHEERDGGHSIGESLRRTYARTGAAVLASGTTAIAGFAVLIATEIRMLRDFGLVTVVDLAVALVGVMLVLPAALVWAEGGFQPLPEAASRLRRRLGGLRPTRAVRR